MFLFTFFASAVVSQNCGPLAGNALCVESIYPCCSQHGWCGNTPDHCGVGCNPLYGLCGSSTTTTEISTMTATISATTVPTPIVPGTCGPTANNAVCSEGINPCCSEHGWCGNTDAHCGTRCNPLYGLCGDISTSTTVVSATPSASPTPTDPLPVVITDCVRPNSIAITYDDGPYLYTSRLLDILRANRVRATFFINGQNRMNINDPSASSVVRRAFRDRHQIAHHTWSHTDLTLLNTTGILSEMNRLSEALQGIIGRRPRFVRPPYGAINGAVAITLSNLGYRIVSWSIDTNDWRTPDTPPDITQLFSSGVPDRKIILAHDPLPNSVEPFTQNLLNYVRSRGLTTMTVAECLGETPYF